MTTIKYTLEQFVQDMEGLIAGQPTSKRYLTSAPTGWKS